MGSKTDDTDQGVSTRDRIESFVDTIDDVPGVRAGVRGIGDEAYARVNVEFDYGTRDEYGDGKVVVSNLSEDPVGREAFDRDLRIVRVQPRTERDELAFWFATREDADQGEAPE